MVTRDLRRLERIRVLRQNFFCIERLLSLKVPRKRPAQLHANGEVVLLC